MDPKQTLNREGYGDEIYEKVDFQLKVREKFKEFHNKQYWNVIDAAKTKEEVANCILDVRFGDIF